MIFKKINYERVSSTNDIAIQMATDNEICEPTVILAKSQKNGRGRGSHLWISENIGNIYSSYVFDVGKNIKKLPQLTLLSGLGIIRALMELFMIEQIENVNLAIKWPNDVLLNHKKIAGILTETVKNDDRYYIVVGIGVNVKWSNKDILKTGLKYAGSIGDIIGLNIDVDVLQSYIQRHLGMIFDKFLQGIYFEHYYEEYNKYLININKEIFYQLNNEEKSGLCMGLDKEGQLIVKDKMNSINKIISGEVNLEGIYGY